MKTEKILIIVLVVLAVAGLVWSLESFFSIKEPAPLVENTQENFAKAMQAELPDKCKTPDDYTEDEWQQHMSHHPDRYKECFTPQEQKAMTRYKNIGPDDLAALLKQKDFELIDVHIPEQVHIPGTDQFIPFNEVIARQNELPQDKDAKIVLYCRSGSMSRTASEALLKMGYTNVYNLAGGINSWKQMGYPLENSK